MQRTLSLLIALACGAPLAQTAPAGAPDAASAARTNAFGDPFGAATSGLAPCPMPAGPLYTAQEVAKETHWRAERGTSCFRSGRCRLPNAYLYDKEIFPRAVRMLQGDERLAGSSLWVYVQRRWVFVQGCVASAEQGAQVEATLRLIDDVEAVIPQLRIGPGASAPYEIAP